MTFQEALQAFQDAHTYLTRIHFKKLHRGSCIRPACMEAMKAITPVREALQVAYDAEQPSIPVFARRPSEELRGPMRFHDWNTGEVLQDYTGLYLSNETKPWVMVTWFDGARPKERCFGAIREYRKP